MIDVQDLAVNDERRHGPDSGLLGFVQPTLLFTEVHDLEIDPFRIQRDRERVLRADADRASRMIENSLAFYLSPPNPECVSGNLTLDGPRRSASRRFLETGHHAMPLPSPRHSYTPRVTEMFEQCLGCKWRRHVLEQIRAGAVRWARRSES